MKLKKFSIIFLMFILILGLVSAASIDEFETNNLIISKKTGLERFFGDITINDDRYNYYLNIQIPDIPQKKGLKNAAFKGRSWYSYRSSSNTEINITLPKTNKHDWIKLGSNSLILEEDNYWNITNQYKSYYISKTGFQVSNYLYDYADIRWQLDMDGTVYDSIENIWNWSYVQDQGKITLTGVSELETENILWIAIWQLDDNDTHIRINLTTNETSRNYFQRLVHQNISISGDSSDDRLYIQENDYYIDDELDINFSSTQEYQIIDNSNYIELLYSGISDAIINIYNGVVTLFTGEKDISLLWTDPSFSSSTNNDDIAIEIMSEDSFVISWCDEIIDNVIWAYYNTTGDQIGNNVTVDSGTGSCQDEGNQVTLSAFNSTHFVVGWRDVTPNNAKFHTYSTDGTSISGEVIVDNNVGGTNTVSVKSLNSTHLLVSWLDGSGSNETADYSVYDIYGNPIISEVTISNDDINAPEDIASDIWNSSTWIIAWSQTTPEVMKFEILVDEASVIDDQLIDDTLDNWNEIDVAIMDEDTFIIAYLDTDDVRYNVYEFDGITALNTLNVTGIDTVNIGTDNIDIDRINNSAFSLMISDVGSSDHKIGVFDIDGNILTSMTEVHNTAADGMATGSSQYNTDNSLCINPDSNNPHIIFASDTNWNATDIGLSSWDGLCSRIPSVTLITPQDNLIDNITLKEFSCSVTDDNQINTTSLYHNATGIFKLNSTQKSSGTSLTTLFNETFEINTSISWNCLSNDSNGNESYAASNFTFTINQTFPPPPPTINPINITLKSPENNSIVTGTEIPFSIFLNTSANATLFINSNENETKFFEAGLRSFDPIQFTENQSITWLINASNNLSHTVSESFIVNFTFQDPPPTPEDEFPLGSCPIQTLQGTLMFMFFIILAFIVMGFGIGIRNGAIGFFGAFILLITSMFIFFCIWMIGVIMTALSILFMSWFVFKGIRNFR